MPKSQADRVLKLLLGVLFLGFVFVIRDVFDEKVIAVGDRAPSFNLTTENGRKISTGDFGGKLLVLNFWATWCPPCIEEMPSLSDFATQMSKQGVVVLGVSVDKNESAYKSFLQRNRLAFQVARDPGADIPAKYGTFKWPETYVINREGTVVQKYIGMRDWTDPRILNEIRASL
ncbi:MAG: TlpA disulfide reductase family protein [Bryobacteraceae bacterium]